MLDGIKGGDIKYVIVEYKDRLARFGYKYLEKYINDFGAEIIIVNEKESSDIQQELVYI